MRGIAVTSENRDEPWARAMRRAAEDMESLFSELGRRDNNVLEQVVGELRLGGPRGPTDVDVPDNRAAWELAKLLTWMSLDGLRTALGRIPATIGDWPLEPPAPDLDRLPDATSFGIPLLAVSSPTAVEAALRMIAARLIKKFAPIHRNLDVRLAEFLAIEDALWQLAEANGGAASRIPYSFRVRALTWFWRPTAHHDGLRAPTVCIRCGTLLIPRRAIGSPPQCPRCAQETTDRACLAHARDRAG
jgi:hypothetical protein